MLGDISIATVATYMLSTFPSIIWSFIVGIGAGVPSNNVRLGDIVVGTPTHNSSGVIQWDFGKDHGEFERMATFTNPPMPLLTSLNALEAQHALEGNKIPECLERLRKQWPQLASSYLQSASLNDMLFEADYKHVTDPEGEGEGDSCRLCDKAMMVKREPREMLIHHGLIASGNRVIRDAKFRDKLNHDLGGNVLCFEVVAAGLVHDFPCLVIKGICDYADSHTNREWRGHAAFVAAAFAKELLNCLLPLDEESKKPKQNPLINGKSPPI
jgi:nucleoside phosphorylase